MRKALLAIGLVVLFAACSSSGSSKSADPGSLTIPSVGEVIPGVANTTVKQTLDPCKVLTAQDAVKLAGVAVTKTAGGGVGSLRCLYTSGKKAGVQVTVRVDASADAAHTDFADWVHPIGGTAKGLEESAVAGLGDEARQTRDPNVNTGIYFRKGATLVKIGAYPPPSPAAMKLAAAAALGRI